MRLLAASLALSLSIPALAVRAPEQPLLPDFDARASRGLQVIGVLAQQGAPEPRGWIAGPDAAPGAVRLAALRALEREAGPVEARWSAVTGSPRILFAQHGALSRPGTEDPVVAARAFLLAHRDLFLMSPAQVERLKPQGVIPAAAGGVVVRFRQQVGGLDVYHGSLAVSLLPDGSVLHVMGGEITGERQPDELARQSDPSRALVQLARMVAVELASLPLPVAALPGGGARFHVAKLGGDVDVRPVAFPTVSGPRLAWKADVSVEGTSGSYEVLVDDATLQPLFRVTRTWFLDTRGRVFTHHPGLSTHDVVRFPDSVDYRVDASPAGWCDESRAVIVTSGNNTIVQDDVLADDETTPGAQAFATAPPQVFDFGFTDGSGADAQSSLTNLFFAINDAHDRFRGLGFDEASGSFQAENFGLGGLGGDPVLGDDRDGSGTNNANFQTPPDGLSGRMQMYLWDGSGSPRSSSFDVGVVYHEYGHGVSTRLVGGPTDATCLFGWQGGSMGEGWSDYWSGTFLEDPVLAAWVSGDPAGIRMFTLDDNPPTGKDYRNFCRYPNDIRPQICEVHDNGEIWSGFLWRVREELALLYGDNGKQLMDQLVILGMKLTPCGPSFLDARDGLILADRLVTRGAHECLIRQVARERFMGFDASSTGGSDAAPVAGNANWPECVNIGRVGFDRDDLESGAVTRYACEDSLTVVVVDGSFDNAPANVTIASSSGDSETAPPSPGAAPGVYQASFAVSVGVPVPGDGTLQVQPGDTLTATYVDGDPAGTSTATATIDCAPRLDVVRHHVGNGSCDDDAVPGYPELPGFLDRDETATIEVELANRMPVGVFGEISVDTDRPDLVTLLPTSPLLVSLPPAVGTSPSSTTIRLVAVGSASIGAGDVATLRFHLDASGFDASVAAATLPLELHRDYALETGLSIGIDAESETGPVGPQFTTGVLSAGGNEWSLVTCRAPAGSTKSYHDGRADCAGNYSDGQGDPWLATPPLALADASTRAARITGAQWQNEIHLGVTGAPAIGIPNAIDADAVAVVLTNDPATFDTSDPLTIAFGSLAFYIKVDIPGIYTQDSNTVGFVLDQRPVQPGQFGGVDLTQPTYLAWYFLPDITPVQPPLDAQALGYFVDDILVSYERVQAVPQAAACTPQTAAYSYPRVLQPGASIGCAGDTVEIDASLSEVQPCGPAGAIEYRFLALGAPVPCWLDAGQVTTRPQDAAGWGPDATCFDFPVADRTYDVEVRCSTDPARTDVAAVTVRVLDGLIALAGEAAWCSSRAPIVLDASPSALAGCPGPREYRFTSAAGPLDCDGDTVADDFGPQATCTIPGNGSAVDVTIEMRCVAFPGCVVQQDLTIPYIEVSPSLVEVAAPPSGLHCVGTIAALDASGSLVSGCAGGQAEYRFQSSAGDDTGWQAAATHDVTTGVDAAWSVEARCSLAPSCAATSAPPLSVLWTTGSPAGTTTGTLRVGKSAPGCAPGSDVLLAWNDADYAPPAYVLVRSDDADAVDPPTESIQDVDGTSAVDAGASCDGGGAPYRGARCYFYVHVLRSLCTGDPLP